MAQQPFSWAVVSDVLGVVSWQIPAFSVTAAHCDFERDSCGWHEFAEGDGFDWSWSSAAKVPTEFQGQSPPRDHTTNTTAGQWAVSSAEWSYRQDTLPIHQLTS